VLLGGDDVREAERAGQRDHTDEGEAHEHLVAHHLGGGAQPAHQRVLAARRPSGQHHAVDRQRRHREHEQEPDVEVGDHPAVGHGDDHEREECRDQHEGRRHHEDAPIGEGRHPVLLEEDLEGVGQHLEEAGRAHTVGAVPVLQEAEEPPLVPDEPGGDREHRDQHPEDDEQLPVPDHHRSSTRVSRTQAGSGR